MAEKVEKKVKKRNPSIKKRIRQTEKRTARNRALRSAMRTAIKKYRKILESGNQEEAKANYPQVQKTLDKMVTKGILHKNTAARYKSRLAAHRNKIEKAG